jgi:hypothetical protein
VRSRLHMDPIERAEMDEYAKDEYHRKVDQLRN